MKLDHDTCYGALLAKDRRFDGWFFVGVSSTGIYCRPVCAARSPKSENCRFFSTRAAAEKAGYRPCLRCRPELAPGSGLLDMSSKLARAAATLIEEGFLDGATLTALAARIGVSDRHLRRIFEAEFGVSLIEFAQTQRLLLAKRLLSDTCLPMGEVALAAGFRSVRRFNDLFRLRYGLSPSGLRKKAGPHASETMSFELAYRPPFAWSALLAFLAHRAIAGVEQVDDRIYARAIEVAPTRSGALPASGWLKVEQVARRHALKVTLPVALSPSIALILGRLRCLFDLDCRPELIDAHLGELAADLPGMRVPGAFDGVEIGVRAIVGQQVSVAYARTVLARIAKRFGTAVAGAPHDLLNAFPRARALAVATPAELMGAGITRIRAEAVIALASEVAAGRIVLDSSAPLEETMAALRRIRGLGEWTVQYIAMRALDWPNALPDGDAVLKKRLGLANARELRVHAHPWEPWRSYATLHVWRRADAVTAADAALSSLKESPVELP